MSFRRDPPLERTEVPDTRAVFRVPRYPLLTDRLKPCGWRPRGCAVDLEEIRLKVERAGVLRGPRDGVCVGSLVSPLPARGVDEGFSSYPTLRSGPAGRVGTLGPRRGFRIPRVTGNGPVLPEGVE